MLESNLSVASSARAAWAKSSEALAGAAALACFSALYYWNAWTVDDAYITYRTIDNLIHGYGPTWNTAERVQTYTHPLWMLLHVPVVYFTREYFFTGIAISFATCSALFAYAWHQLAKSGAGWKLPLLVAGVLASKTLFDYTSSGLENPLSYLLAAAFFMPWLQRSSNVELGQTRVFAYVFLAALAFLNRQDTVILFVPALGYILVKAARSQGRSLIGTLLVATSPAWLWLLFSIVYYGFAFPNTYYAKSANSGVPPIDRVELGWNYLKASMSADLPGLAYLVGAVLYVARRRDVKLALALAGALLYVVYVLVSAASATHMAHRFLTLPVFVALTLLVLELESRRVAALGVACAGIALLLAPNSPLRIGRPSYRALNAPNCADIKWYVHDEGSSLRANIPPGDIVPNNAWYADGLQFRANGEAVRWGGPFSPGSWAMGYFGLGAGPHKHIVDPLGLCDPLLARLPGKVQHPWLSGHFERQLPAGYLETLGTGRNVLEDPSLRAYYAKLQLIIQGPLFSRQRLEAIAGMNLGSYENLRMDYIERARE